MHLDDMTVRIMEENLVPARQRPLTVVGIGNSFFFQPLFEPFDIVGTETEMTPFEWVDELLHLKPEVDILARDVKLDVSVGQKINHAIEPLGGILPNETVFSIGDAAKAEYRLIKLRDSWHVFRAQIHVVIIEFHEKYGLPKRNIVLQI